MTVTSYTRTAVKGRSDGGSKGRSDGDSFSAKLVSKVTYTPQSEPCCLEPHSRNLHEIVASEWVCVQWNYVLTDIACVYHSLLSSLFPLSSSLIPHSLSPFIPLSPTIPQTTFYLALNLINGVYHTHTHTHTPTHTHPHTTHTPTHHTHTHTHTQPVCGVPGHPGTTI